MQLYLSYYILYLICVYGVLIYIICLFKHNSQLPTNRLSDTKKKKKMLIALDAQLKRKFKRWIVDVYKKSKSHTNMLIIL